jgi:hypothetical protein
MVRKTDFIIRVVLVQIFLKLKVRKLVSFLMFSIKSTIFLNGIVGQMDQLIAHIVKVEGIGRCSDVALAVPVSSHLPMKSCYDHVMPDIELPPFVKQRVLYILLDDISL